VRSHAYKLKAVHIEMYVYNPRMSNTFLGLINPRNLY